MNKQKAVGLDPCRQGYFQAGKWSLEMKEEMRFSIVNNSSWWKSFLFRQKFISFVSCKQGFIFSFHARKKERKKLRKFVLHRVSNDGRWCKRKVQSQSWIFFHEIGHFFIVTTTDLTSEKSTRSQWYYFFRLVNVTVSAVFILLLSKLKHNTLPVRVHSHEKGIGSSFRLLGKCSDHKTANPSQTELFRLAEKLQDRRSEKNKCFICLSIFFVLLAKYLVCSSILAVFKIDDFMQLIHGSFKRHSGKRTRGVPMVYLVMAFLLLNHA